MTSGTYGLREFEEDREGCGDDQKEPEAPKTRNNPVKKVEHP